MQLARLCAVLGQILLLLPFASVRLIADIPTSEREALVALYDKTNGSGWTRNNNWLGPPGTECMWFMVRCDEEQTTVTEITLDGNGLSGTLPTELGQLTGLQFLGLYQNQLTGPIPPSIGQLTNLSVLDLSRNQLTGSIPSSIGNLVNLTELYLQMNQLSGSIPPELGQLTNVQEFGLWMNQLTGTIPSELGQLSSAEFLVLGANPLTGPIPPELGDLTNLTRLYLGDSGISGTIPSELGQLSNLELLHLGQTDLSGPIPAEIGHLTNLQGLNLARTRLSGEIPGSFANLTALPNPMPPPPPFLGLDLSYAALETSNPTLDAFLDSKQLGGNWSATQTIAPRNVTVSSTAASSVTLTWSPIEYTQDPGAYEVFVSSAPTGQFTLGAATTDKSVSQVSIGNLAPATEWFFKLRTVTEAHPPNNVHRVESDLSAVISATTTGGAPKVVVTRFPGTMVQETGEGGATTSFALKNIGDSGTTIALTRDSADFFDQSPASFTLDAGKVQVVTVTGLPKAAGIYEGRSLPSGAGADSLEIPIRLLSQAPPESGVADVVTKTPRIDVAVSGEEPVTGTVTMENIGTATAVGIIESDESWLVFSDDLVTIDPGQSVDVDFTIDPSEISDETWAAGSLSAFITFSYLDSAVQTKGLVLHGSSNTNVAVTSSTLLVTPVIGSDPSAIPAIAQGEVALFVAGVKDTADGGIGFSTDLSMTNLSSSQPLNGIDLYFRPLEESASPSKGQVAIIPLAQSTSFGDAFGALDIDSPVGSLVLRSTEVDMLDVRALQIVKSSGAGKVFRTTLPVFRSDRALGVGESFALPGLEIDETSRTDIYLQETRGLATTIDVVFHDDLGVELAADDVELDPFGLARLSSVDEIPSGTASVFVSVRSGGEVVGYAMTTNLESGRSWITVDWRLVFEGESSDEWCVPIAGNLSGSGSRRRPVRVGDTLAMFDATRASELVLENMGTTSAGISVTYRSRTGSVEEAAPFSMQPFRTYEFSDVVAELFGREGGSGGTIYVDGDSLDSVVIGSRSYLVDDDARTTVPAVPASNALAEGEAVTIVDLEDSDRATIAARVPGTVRTTVGFVSIGSEEGRVRVSVYFPIPGSLAAPVGGTPFGSRELVVPAGGLQILPDIVGAVLGPARDESYGYLRGVSVVVEVLAGSGPVIAFDYSVDNATGELIVPMR